MITNDTILSNVKGIKKSFDNAAKYGIDKYMDNRIFDLYETDEFFEIFTSTEGMSGAKKLSELETPPTMILDEGYSVTITEERFGGAIIVSETEKRKMRDGTTKVENYLTKERNLLLRKNQQLFLRDVFGMLNNAFSSSADELAPDGIELCGTHLWSNGNSFVNYDTQALDDDAVDTMVAYGGAFLDPKGIDPMPIDFDTIIVKKGSAAAKMARRLFAEGISPIAVADINIYEGEYTIVATPYISNALHWFGRASGEENSVKVGIGEYPTLREPITEVNEAVRTNCTGFWKKGIVNMPFDWYGSIGTT